MMQNSTPPPHGAEPARGSRPGPSRAGRSRRFIPVALATVVTLVLGGASAARAVDAQPLDARADLEFSLDGATWTEAPDLVLGSWGCNVTGDPAIDDPFEAIGGTEGVDPCSMGPGEAIDRTYYVRNSTDTGRAGRYEVGVGDFVVSDEAEFEVSSTIAGPADSDARSVTLFGAATAQAGQSPDRGSAVAALELAPGQSAQVVDEVSIPADPQNYEQRQSVSPRMWVSFSDVTVIDTDGDSLPDTVENELGTDPLDPFNLLPVATVGQRYGPEPFLPTPPAGTGLEVDQPTLPPGMRLEDGALTGTPTRAGTYDVAFTVTMPDGATYSSVRRIVVESAGEGSADLPDFVWPVVIIGGIAVIAGILGPGFGSLAGSVGGSTGGSLGGSLGGSIGGSAGGFLGSLTAPGGLLAGLFGSSGSAGAAGSAGSSASAGSAGSEQDPDAGPSDPGGSGPSGPGGGDADDTIAADGARPDGAPSDGTGQVRAESVTHQQGEPSSEWARANSDVRSSLPTTGVAVADLVLWALTAAAAGVTLLLLAHRSRREQGEN